jgi:type I restriction enzyme S subunit
VLRLVTGTTVFHLYASEMKNFVLSLPPIDEQRAIAGVLIDMCDEIQELERQRNKTAQLKQGMMQQLLTGRIRLI